MTSFTRVAVAITVCAAVVALAFQNVGHLHGLFGMPHANKRFATWRAFFPFYMSEHSDPVCRVLHVVGTSLSSLFFITRPTLLISFVTALAVAFMASELLIATPNGAIEGAIMVTVYVMMSYYQSRRFGWEPLLIGYAFAWVGHFVFEKNKPATFLYPSYSLASDYAMLFNIVSGKTSLGF